MGKISVSVKIDFCKNMKPKEIEIMILKIRFLMVVV